MPVRIITLNSTQKYICKDNPTTKRVVYFMQNMDNAQLLACFAFISTSQYVPLCLQNIKYYKQYFSLGAKLNDPRAIFDKGHKLAQKGANASWR